MYEDSETFSILKHETIKTECDIDPEQLFHQIKEEISVTDTKIEHFVVDDVKTNIDNEIKTEEESSWTSPKEEEEKPCPKVLMPMDLLKKGNKKNYPGVIFKCLECGFIPEKQTKKDIKLHLAMHRDSQGLKRSIIRSDTVDLTCSYCKKTFKAFSDLQRHLVQHTGERTWQCEVCPKSFGQKYHLTRHMETHSGVRNQVWHMCNICGKEFTSSRSRNVHELSHSGEFLYYCEYCNKGFNEKSIMHKHVVKRHGGSYEHFCEKCERGFMTSRALNTHKPICGIVKPKKVKKMGVHPCVICNKIFNRKCNLERHIKCHNGEKEFTCDQCGKQFRDYRSIISHKKKKHERDSSEWETGVLRTDVPADTELSESNDGQNTSENVIL